MPRRSSPQRTSGYTILLVDDSPEYLEATSQLLEQEGHHVLSSPNGPAALVLLREEPIDLLLLDYTMPGMTGEEVVAHLRRFNTHIQVILQTGYASEQLPREMLRRLDIQGYYDKSEGPEKLLLWTDVGLKAASTVQLLQQSRQGLRYILEVTPHLHRLQPLQDLLQGMFLHIAGLLGAVHSFLAFWPEGAGPGIAAVETEGFLAMLEEDTELVVQTGTGRFDRAMVVSHYLDTASMALIAEALQHGRGEVRDGAVVLPLRVGELTVGILYLDRPALKNQELELLHLFANQAAVAIQNAQLYQMATYDPLTRAYVRRFFEQCLLRELRLAFRSGRPLTLLLADIDSMKRINDDAGHLVGDQALAIFGKALQQVIRAADLVGRYGGDEFAIILPQTDLAGGTLVAERLLTLLEALDVPGPAGALPLRSSIGVAMLQPHAFAAADIPRPMPASYFRRMAHTLLERADAALYQAKRRGGQQFQPADETSWLSLTPPPEEPA